MQSIPAAEQEDIRADWKDAFDEFADKGQLDLVSMRKALLSLGKDLAIPQLQQMIGATGTIDFNTFTQSMTTQMKGPANPTEIETALLTMDKQGNGFLSTKELQYSMMQMGERMPSDEAHELLAEADQGGTGTVNAKAFAQLLVTK